MKNKYFIEISCKIDKFKWVFCISDGVRQKKQVFCVKQTESFKKSDVVALIVSRYFRMTKYSVVRYRAIEQ